MEQGMGGVHDLGPLPGLALPRNLLHGELASRRSVVVARGWGFGAGHPTFFWRQSADGWNRLVCIQQTNGGRNRDRTYDLCDVNVRLEGVEIGLRSRIRRSTSILPQQQLFRLLGRRWRTL